MLNIEPTYSPLDFFWKPAVRKPESIASIVTVNTGCGNLPGKGIVHVQKALLTAQLMIGQASYAVCTSADSEDRRAPNKCCLFLGQDTSV